MTTPSEALYLGLISGTSMDGVDAALIQRAGNATALVAAITTPYPAELARELRHAATGNGNYEVLGRLDVAVGEAFAAVAHNLLVRAGVSATEVAAIGSHGQTVLHRPDLGFSIQIGDPARIAQRTGIITVADFRRADLGAGGEGAPLAPAFHKAIFSDAHETRAVLNLGGISNLTLLRPGEPVLAFDVGPANTLLDAIARQVIGTPFDRDGKLAATGNIHRGLLEALLADPWFARLPPKSTGPEYFNLEWVRRHQGADSLSPADLAATLVEVGARAVADALRNTSTTVRGLYCCGGGVHNPVMMARLVSNLPGVQIMTTETLGVNPDYVEAMCFAWLAGERLSGRAGNLPSVTGARRSVPLGTIHSP